RWSEGVGAENVRWGLSFAGGCDKPTYERHGMEFDRAGHGSSGSAGVGFGGEGDRRISVTDARALTAATLRVRTHTSWRTVGCAGRGSLGSRRSWNSSG